MTSISQQTFLSQASFVPCAERDRGPYWGIRIADTPKSVTAIDPKATLAVTRFVGPLAARRRMKP